MVVRLDAALHTHTHTHLLFWFLLQTRKGVRLSTMWQLNRICQEWLTLDAAAKGEILGVYSVRSIPCSSVTRAATQLPNGPLELSSHLPAFKVRECPSAKQVGYRVEAIQSILMETVPGEKPRPDTLSRLSIGSVLVMVDDILYPVWSSAYSVQ